MTYVATIHKEHDHIRLYVVLDRTPGIKGNFTNAISRMVEICQAKNITRILCICDITRYLPTMIVQMIIAYFKEIGWDKRFKLALVDLDKESLEEKRFLEFLLVDEGYFFKMFENEQDAKAWLLES